MKILRSLALAAAATLLAANSFAGVPTPMQAPASATPGHAVGFGSWPDLAVDSGKAFPTGAIVGTTDTQVITGKSIDASEVNSGVLNIARLPALSSGSALLMGDGAGRFANVTIGAGLNLTGSTLSSTVTGGVTSVFGRTGAVVAASNDYSFAQIGSKPTTLSGYGITDALAAANNLSDLANAATARANLGVAIGSNVEAWDADLDALAALTGTNTLYYRSGLSSWSPVTIGSGLSFGGGTLANSHVDAVASVFGRTGTVTAQSGDYSFAQIGSTPTTLAGYGITDGLVVGNNLSDVPNKATARTNLGLAIGTDVQAQNQDLQGLSSVVQSNKIYYRVTPGVWQPINIGVNCSFVLSVLNCGGAAGTVSSVFGRVGAVVAQAGDYTFDQVGAAPATTGNSILYADGSGGFLPVTIGSGLDFTSGTLSAAGAVSSVFGRSGAVTAQSGDYSFAQIGSKPTTLSGYGITDALAAANNLSDLANTSTARTNLGVAIGSNVEAWDADLDALAALSGTGVIYYRSGLNTWSAVTIGSGLGFTGGTLSNTSAGAVSSVFGRTGAVVATTNDYTFAQIASTPTTLSGYGITDGVTTGTAQSITAAKRSTPVTLSLSTSTFTPNFDTGQNFTATLVHFTCPCTIANPSTTLVAGQSGVIEVIQSSSGSETVTWGSEYVAAGGIATIVLSTTGNSRDYISYYVNGNNQIVLSMGAQGVSH